MEHNNQNSPEQNQRDAHHSTPAQEDAAKTPPARTDREIEEANKEGVSHDKKERKVSAAAINAITGSATSAVHSRHGSRDALAQTGTNVSYEGPTSNAPGGTGYNSGQSATGSSISTPSQYEAGGAAREEDTEDEE